MQLRLKLLLLLFLPLLVDAQTEFVKEVQSAINSVVNVFNEDIDEIEIDILSSYYEQDGNHSAVKGGEGTQFLNDIVGMIIVNVPFLEKNVINMSLGLDTYTSASTAMIDMQPSGASFTDERKYGNVSYTRLNDKVGDFAVGIGFSSEWDVNSTSYNLGWSYTDPTKNWNVGLKNMGIFDSWRHIYPAELRKPITDGTVAGLNDRQRRTYGFAVNYSQVLSRKFQIALNYDLVVQQGLLSTPFHRVYMDTANQTVLGGIPISSLSDELLFALAERDIERLPGARTKHAIALRTSWHASNTFLLRTFARYYTDDFGIDAYTVSAELPIKFNRFISLSPFYRYYTQTRSDYFKPIFQHVAEDEFYTSDYDLSEFTSYKYGAGLRISPAFGIVSFPGITSNRTSQFKYIDIRYSIYERSDGLSAYIINAGIGFAF